jgi:hypothetical protein
MNSNLETLPTILNSFPKDASFQESQFYEKCGATESTDDALFLALSVNLYLENLVRHGHLIRIGSNLGGIGYHTFAFPRPFVSV